MPYVRIETRGDWLRARAETLFDRIDQALVRVLKVPPNDAMIRLCCHPADLMRLPAGASDDFVFIEVALFPGRNADTKAALYRELTAALATLGIAPAAITIALLEIGLDDWGIGGEPARSLRLAFPLQP